MICPFCHYERIKEDCSPEWACPKCGKAYKKFDSAQQRKNEKVEHSEDEDEGNPKVAFIVYLLVFIYEVNNLYDLAVYQKIRWCGNWNCSYIIYENFPIGFVVAVLLHFIVLFFSMYVLYRTITKR
ncbi:MAG: hypothetical protein QNK36_01905 [Colwellia sp.]|nr:hypothetical protein [Colwellia sp.]